MPLCGGLINSCYIVRTVCIIIVITDECYTIRTRQLRWCVCPHNLPSLPVTVETTSTQTTVSYNLPYIQCDNQSCQLCCMDPRYLSFFLSFLLLNLLPLLWTYRTLFFLVIRLSLLAAILLEMCMRTVIPSIG